MKASSHRAITKKVTRSAWFMIPLCLPVICLAIYYTPFLVSLGWHVTHGMAANYQGFRIPVPLGCTADTGSSEDFTANPQGILLERQSKTLHFERPGPETMFFNRLPPDAQSTTPSRPLPGRTCSCNRILLQSTTSAAAMISLQT